MLANNGTVEMNLFLPHPSKIKRNAPKNAHVVQGDVLNMEQLKHAIDGQDIVYANLTGDDIDSLCPPLLLLLLLPSLLLFASPPSEQYPARGQTRPAGPR